jgi:hypothetical protein
MVRGIFVKMIFSGVPKVSPWARDANRDATQRGRPASLRDGPGRQPRHDASHGHNRVLEVANLQVNVGRVELVEIAGITSYEVAPRHPAPGKERL